MGKRLYKRRDSIVCRKIGAEWVLVPINKSFDEKDCLYSFNEIGSFIWERLDGKRGIDAIAEELAKESGKEAAVVKKDCAEFLQDLVEEKLVVPA